MLCDFESSNEFSSKITAIESIELNRNTDHYVDDNIVIEFEKKVVSSHVIKRNHDSIVPYSNQSLKHQISYYFYRRSYRKNAAWTETIHDVIDRYFIDKYVMYCNSRATTESLIDALNCKYYHSQMQNKRKIFYQKNLIDFYVEINYLLMLYFYRILSILE